jgi:hypothetical protein
LPSRVSAYTAINCSAAAAGCLVSRECNIVTERNVSIGSINCSAGKCLVICEYNIIAGYRQAETVLVYRSAITRASIAVCQRDVVERDGVIAIIGEVKNPAGAVAIEGVSVAFEDETACGNRLFSGDGNGGSVNVKRIADTTGKIGVDIRFVVNLMSCGVDRSVAEEEEENKSRNEAQRNDGYALWFSVIPLRFIPAFVAIAKG